MPSSPALLTASLLEFITMQDELVKNGKDCKPRWVLGAGTCQESEQAKMPFARN